MNCENCQNEHEGTYGSGRFCSSKCARGFSTKEKRSLINEKVSNSNKLKYPEIISNCKECKLEIRNKGKSNKIFCSQSCSSKFHMNTPESKLRLSEHFSKLMYKRHAEGDPTITWKSRINREPSYPEKIYMQILNDLGIDYIREFPVGKYNLDFKIFDNFDLEIDGRTHEDEEVKLKDIRRDEYLKSLGYTIIRIKWKNNKDHLNELKEILKTYNLL